MGYRPPPAPRSQLAGYRPVTKLDTSSPPRGSTEDNICAYCGSVYSGEKYNCPNCAAPKMKESESVSTICPLTVPHLVDWS